MIGMSRPSYGTTVRHYEVGGEEMSVMSLHLLSAPLTSPPVGSCFIALNVATVTLLLRSSGLLFWPLLMKLEQQQSMPCRAHSPTNHHAAFAAPENRPATQIAGRSTPARHAAGNGRRPGSACPQRNACLPDKGRLADIVLIDKIRVKKKKSSPGLSILYMI